MGERDRLAADLAGPEWAGSRDWTRVVVAATSAADLADRLIALGWGNVAAEGERIAREVARLRVDEIIGAPAGYEDGWNAATLAVLAIVPADR